MLFAYRGVKRNKDKKCFSFEQHFTGYRIINKSKMLRYTIKYKFCSGADYLGATSDNIYTIKLNVYMYAISRNSQIYNVLHVM